MRTNINFTEEELLFIEKTMDNGTGLNEMALRKNVECFFMYPLATNNNEDIETVKKFIMKHIQELGESYIIMKSIRDKIEELRK